MNLKATRVKNVWRKKESLYLKQIAAILYLKQIAAINFIVKPSKVAECLQSCAVARTVMGLNPHQCLWIYDPQVCISRRLSCHADLYTVSRCHTKCESEDHTGEKACKQGTHPGFDTQGRCHQKSKIHILVSVAPQKGLASSKFFFKKSSLSFAWGKMSLAEITLGSSTKLHCVIFSWWK